MKYEATDNIIRPPTPLIRHSNSEGYDDIGDNQFLKNVKPISAFKRYGKNEKPFVEFSIYLSGIQISKNVIMYFLQHHQLFHYHNKTFISSLY